MAVQQLPAADADGQPGRDVLVSRQPVLDVELRVTGYQVSYADLDGTVDRLFGDVLSTIGLEEIVGNSVAHLMISSEMLQAVGSPPVPRARVVLRLDHDAAIDPALKPVLDTLAEDGYVLALSGLPKPSFDPRQLRHFTIFEIDLDTWDELDAAAAVTRIAAAGRRPLAAGLRTYSDFEMARAVGFESFTGPFYAAPRVTEGRGVPLGDVGPLAALARLRGDAEIEELEQLIDHDLGLSVKLLRYINSAYFGFGREIVSIRQAVMMLGSREVSRWVLMIALAGAPRASRELSVMALTRARMCQLLGEQARAADDELFTIGLLSLADALLDIPLGTVIGQLPLARNLEDALLWREGPAGELLEAAIAFERGDFDAERLRPHRGAAAAAYRESLHWARETVARLS